MTTGMLQDTMQTSPSGLGPRFRPYASPNHHVTKGRYITSNDPRGYIPVYEYPLNGQWIMMDIDDGYILWTGIWKALGNSKADIVKMIDSQPDLAPLIRRVRGGYLKIQGTWMPYEVALRLSRRVAWPIRDDLIPLFGPTFPSTCLSPDQPGFGQVVASGANRRRARRNTQNVPALANASRDPHANWTVVTPTSGANGHQSIPRQSLPPYAPSTDLSPRFAASTYYPNDQQPQYQGYSLPSDRLPPPVSHLKVENSPSMPTMTRDRVRYSPYSNHTSISTRKPTPSKGSLSLDIPSLSMRNEQQSHSYPRAADMEPINLPPIHPPSLRATGQSPYALPPISALEDLRGIHAHDSAAVLRRLRLEDDYSESRSPTDDQTWARRHFLSSQPQRAGADKYSSARSTHPSQSHYEQQRSRSPSEYSEYPPSHHSDLSLSVPSEASHDGNSTCDPSPVSPATPRSTLSTKDSPLNLVPLSTLKGQSRLTPGPASYAFHGTPLVFNGANRSRDRDSDTRRSARRSFSDADSDADSSPRPLRPW